MINLCQFGQNLTIPSEDSADKPFLYSYMSLVTLKLDQGDLEIRSRSPKSNYYLRSPNDVDVPVWSKAIR